jgi:hypothetical protein
MPPKIRLPPREVVLPSDRRKLSALLIVPLVMVIADVVADRTALKFLLLPPFGALTYVVFVNPGRVDMNVRRVILCPTATGVYAWLLANALGYNAVSVALAVIGTMLIMWLLDTVMIVPPLALALLTVLLHDQVRGQVDYIISVFVFTIFVYGLYLVWLRLPLDHHADEPSRPEQEQTG